MRINHLYLLTFFIFLYGFASQAAIASIKVIYTSDQLKRVALVIGNNAYQNAPLNSPVKDASKIANNLSILGFNVDKRTNINNRGMKKAVQTFARSLRDNNTVGLFYYSGYSIQFEGSNYLLPVGAKIDTASDIEFEAIDATRILKLMERAENKLNLFILDASRKHPYSEIYGPALKGLTKMNPPNGSIILYSTAPGDITSSGSEQNSLFTKLLLKNITKSGVSIEDAFRNTSLEVSNASGKTQSPYIDANASGEFYLNNKPTKASKLKLAKPKPKPIQLEPTKENVISNPEEEKLYYEQIQKIATVKAYKMYLQKYPNGIYTDIANYHINELSEQNITTPSTVESKLVDSGPVTSMVSISGGKPEMNKIKLTIRSNQHMDTVKVNGVNKGSSRLDLMLKPGIYDVSVSKKGYQTWARKVDLKLNDKVVYAKLHKLKKLNKTVKPVKYDTISDHVTGMEFVKIPKGCFQMGSKFGKDNANYEHQVCITNDYYLGQYEVTRKEWQEVMGPNPLHFEVADKRPVVKVNWNTVQEFIKRLNNRSGLLYRLPTEAEWEYACKGGESYNYCGGNKVGKLGWYKHNSDNKVHKVGQKKSNKLGLYDMSGNVSEWVYDFYQKDYYRDSKEKDPQGPTKSGGFLPSRSIRGGSYMSEEEVLMSTYRDYAKPFLEYENIGFRLVRVP